MESGVQNTTLAFLIASNLLAMQEMVKPALVYSLYSFWTACLFAYFTNRANGNPVGTVDGGQMAEGERR